MQNPSYASKGREKAKRKPPVGGGFLWNACMRNLSETLLVNF